MKTVREFLEEFVEEPFVQAIYSGQRRQDAPSKIKIRPVELKGQLFFQSSAAVGDKVFHANHPRGETAVYMEELLKDGFSQLQIQGRGRDGAVLVSKKGRMTMKVREHAAVSAPPAPRMLAHNRVKNYILKEGVPVPFLVELGVMNAQGKVLAARYDKFRQINRFLEFVEDILPELPRDREVTILDFGCGKSYLTFAIYYFLKTLRNYDVKIIGLDLKADVIEKCSRLAEACGYEKLHFFRGDIADYEGVTRVDMVVTLHACDTATDFALSKAVEWGAKVILSVPCCQHELNRQIKNELLEPVLRYGILKERMSALLTDGIRANLLEAEGYETQILEFIDMEHTPKNLLIRAVRRGERKDPAGLREMMRALGVTPLLENLLSAERNGEKENREI